MIEYIVIAVLVLIILGTLIHYNKKNLPAKSCNNCRFYDKDTGVCELGEYIPACKQWEWNGERNGN